MDALVMAGGFKGTRLQPLTFSLPEPLHARRRADPFSRSSSTRCAARAFAGCSCRSATRVISCGPSCARSTCPASTSHSSPEPEPLGTAGALAVLPDDVESLFMINGDILTDVDFAAVLQGHRAQDEAWLTVVTTTTR